MDMDPGVPWLRIQSPYKYPNCYATKVRPGSRDGEILFFNGYRYQRRRVNRNRTRYFVCSHCNISLTMAPQDNRMVREPGEHGHPPDWQAVIEEWERGDPAPEHEQAQPIIVVENEPAGEDDAAQDQGMHPVNQREHVAGNVDNAREFLAPAPAPPLVNLSPVPVRQHRGQNQMQEDDEGRRPDRPAEVPSPGERRRLFQDGNGDHAQRRRYQAPGQGQANNDAEGGFQRQAPPDGNAAGFQEQGGQPGAGPPLFEIGGNFVFRVYSPFGVNLNIRFDR